MWYHTPMPWPLVLGSIVASSPQELELDPQRQPAHSSLALPEGVEPPRLDGVLDDEVWGLALPFPELRQVVPVAGATPSQRTEIRAVHSRTALYLALACYDDDPAGIRATQAERDAELDPDDRVEILLDTLYDRRNGFWFQIGAAGSLGDALIARNGSSFNKDWDGIWDGRARVTDEGWFAELEIPFATLEFTSDVERFGINVRRLIRRDNEEARLASPDPALRFFDASFAATLTGLEGIERGLGVDLKPFVVAGYERDDESGDRDRRGDAGLDLFWRVFPGAKLSLSYNTDFAETEVDDRQVNLTRFSLFFPEKRDFFLEDSSAFVFGPGGFGSRDVLPFFSRTIGLSDEGDPVPILLASKFVARGDRGGVGLLGVLTDDHGGLDGQELAVVRPALAVGERSDVGLIGTYGDPASELDASTWGVDTNLRTAELFGDKNGRLSAYFIRSESDPDPLEPSEPSDGNAWLVELDYPNDQISAAATYLEVERGFDPALGFVRRTNIKRYDAEFGWQPRLYTDVRNLDFEVFGTLVTDRGGDTESERLGVQPFGIRFESDDRISTFVAHEREVIEDPFDIAEQATIVPGDYQFLRYGLDVSTSEARAVDGFVGLEGGQFYDGHRRDLFLGLDWRPNSLLELGIDYDYRDLDVAGEDFDVHVGGLGLELVFSPTLSWDNLWQYDDVSKDLGWNSRVRWIVAPGNELFFVVNQSWLADESDFVPLDGQAVAKLTWTFRF